MSILAAQINPKVADIPGNETKVLSAIRRAKDARCSIVLFSEMVLLGYPPEDFLLLPHLIDELEKSLLRIIPETEGITAIIGTVRRNPNRSQKGLFNTAAIVSNGKLIGYQDKCLLPTYDVFSERRYFEPSHEIRIWELNGKKTAITICEDIWQHSAPLQDISYDKDPVLDLKNVQIDLLLNLSASPFHVGKFPTRLKVCKNVANTLKCPVILCNQVGGNDSLIFDGYSMYLGSDGGLLKVAKGFCEDDLYIDLDKKLNPITFIPDSINDLYSALVLGLKDYFCKLGFKTACLGVSGGIDSALVACIAKDALGAENVLGVGMPSRFSSEGSIKDTSQLVHNLGIRYRHIPIEQPFEAYLELLAPFFEGKPFDTTEENLQARIRGAILMALSNKLGYIVLSTGNKSELAMGYSTLYGDMVGGLGVINDLTKGQVYALCRWINREGEVIPWDTINKPPSAELRENQKDSDSLPDYAIVDTVLQEYIENYLSPEEIAKKHSYPLELVKGLVRRIHANEYKRRQSPPGLRVSGKAFSVGRRFPIVEGWI